MSEGIRKPVWILLLMLAVVVVSYVFYGGQQSREQVNVFDALQKHHAVIEKLLDQTAKNREKFADLKKNLEVHERLEENILFYTLEGKPPVRKDALLAIEEHHMIDILTNELTQMPQKNEHWPIKLELLSQLIRRHFTFEEQKLFPEARKMMDPKEMNAMGQRFVQEKKDFMRQ